MKDIELEPTKSDDQKDHQFKVSVPVKKYKELLGSSITVAATEPGITYEKKLLLALPKPEISPTSIKVKKSETATIRVALAEDIIVVPPDNWTKEVAPQEDGFISIKFSPKENANSATASIRATNASGSTMIEIELQIEQ